MKGLHIHRGRVVPAQVGEGVPFVLEASPRPRPFHAADAFSLLFIILPSGRGSSSPN